MEGIVQRCPIFLPLNSASPALEESVGMIGNFINEHHLAAQLGLTVWALRKWRRRGYGPVPRKMGKRVM
jgi:hypothetical protein